MATIQERKLKDGSTRYRVIVRQKGHKPETATFRRKTDAKEWAKKIESAMLENRHFKNRVARKRTLAELIEKYIKEVMPKKSDIMQQQVIQLNWWKEQMGHMTLAELSSRDIAKHRDILLNSPVKEDTPRKPSTVNRYLAVLSHAFTIAVEEWEWLQDNPAKKVRRLSESKGRTRFLSEQEMTDLLEVCKASECKVLFPIVLIALSTGARKMEILNLRWKDVDFKREVIILRKTKNKETRSIPLKGQALSILSDMKRVRRIDTDLVFPGNNPLSPIEFRKHWVQALKTARIENFKFHDLRHTAASYLAMNGASLMEISAILGHKTLEMVKRYAHLTEAHTAEIVERMNRKILG